MKWKQSVEVNVVVVDEVVSKGRWMSRWLNVRCDDGCLKVEVSERGG